MTQIQRTTREHLVDCLSVAVNEHSPSARLTPCTLMRITRAVNPKIVSQTVAQRQTKVIPTESRVINRYTAF